MPVVRQEERAYGTTTRGGYYMSLWLCKQGGTSRLEGCCTMIARHMNFGAVLTDTTEFGPLAIFLHLPAKWNVKCAIEDGHCSGDRLEKTDISLVTRTSSSIELRTGLVRNHSH